MASAWMAAFLLPSLSVSLFRLAYRAILA